MKRLLAAALCTALLGCQPSNPEEAASLQGVVEIEEVVVSFEVAGPVELLRVHRGDDVARGAVIAQVDSDLARTAREAKAAELQALRAELALMRAGTRTEEIRATAARLKAARAIEKTAVAQLDRQQQLVDEGALPAASLDTLDQQVSQTRGERQALEQQLRAQHNGARPEQIAALEARITAAEAGLTSADERLARHVLHAPLAASVLDVHVETGELAGPGIPVATLGDLAHPYVDVFVPQDEIAGVKVGMGAAVKVDALERSLSGRVDHVFRHTEFTPRYLFSERERGTLVVRARIVVDDPDHVLPAGVPAFVTLEPAGGAGSASP